MQCMENTDPQFFPVLISWWGKVNFLKASQLIIKHNKGLEVLTQRTFNMNITWYFNQVLSHASDTSLALDMWKKLYLLIAEPYTTNSGHGNFGLYLINNYFLLDIT